MRHDPEATDLSIKNAGDVATILFPLYVFAFFCTGFPYQSRHPPCNIIYGGRKAMLVGSCKSIRTEVREILSLDSRENQFLRRFSGKTQKTSRQRPEKFLEKF